MHKCCHGELYGDFGNRLTFEHGDDIDALGGGVGFRKIILTRISAQSVQHFIERCLEKIHSGNLDALDLLQGHRLIGFLGLAPDWKVPRWLMGLLAITGRNPKCEAQCDQGEGYRFHLVRMDQADLRGKGKCGLPLLRFLELRSWCGGGTGKKVNLTLA